jgi:hypothetical protein
MASADPKPTEQDKATPADQNKTQTPSEQQPKAAALGEDDEFEDFPVDGALRVLPWLQPLGALCHPIPSPARPLPTLHELYA